MTWLKGVLPLHQCPSGRPGSRESWWEKDDSAGEINSGWEALKQRVLELGENNFSPLPRAARFIYHRSKGDPAKRQLWPDPLKPECIWAEHSPLRSALGLLPAPSCVYSKEQQMVVYAQPDTAMLGLISTAHCCAPHLQHQLWAQLLCTCPGCEHTPVPLQDTPVRSGTSR